MTIDLYYSIISPPCRSVMMTAKELNIELNLKQLNMAEGEHRTPEFEALNPQHCVPTLDDNGFVLWESRAIMRYLCNEYAPDSDLYPTSPKKRAVVDRMLDFDIGSYYTAIKEAIYPKFYGGIEPSADKVNTLDSRLNQLNDYIGENRYVACDHLTIADIAILANTTVLTVTEYDITSYANVFEWYERLQSELPYVEEINNEETIDACLKFAEKMRERNN